MLVEKFSLNPYRTVMIGDRLDTDVLCGKNANIKTVLVLSGATSRDDEQFFSNSAGAHARPDYVLENIASMFAASTPIPKL